MQLDIAHLTPGDRIKDFELPSHTGQQCVSNQPAGKPAVLVFCGIEQAPASSSLLLGLRDGYAQFESRGVRVVGISINPVEKLRSYVEEHRIPFPMLSDAQFRVSTLFGALRPKEQQPEDSDKLELNALRRTFLIGPDQRIARIYDNPSPATHAAQLLSDIDALLTPEPPRRIGVHAPVLLIPNVLPPDVCARLILVWHEQGNEDSGFMRQVDGKTVGAYDYSHKIRRDHFLKPGPDLDAVKKYMGSRVVPTIRMAFNYEVTRFEDFRIACYDSSRGGYFRPHRDNTTDGTAHRRFAISLLLNDDYGGGALRFPEYGLHEYRPALGGAVVFSCSLLHEATDVTAGRRFVLLSFFYGDKEAKAREEYNLRSGGEYRA